MIRNRVRILYLLFLWVYHMSPLSDLRTSPSADTFAFGLLKDLMLVIAMPLPEEEEENQSKKERKQRWVRSWIY